MSSRERVPASGAIMLALFFVLGACASPAGADPLSMTFTEARANVGKQLSDAALFEAPDAAPFAAQIDPASGAITNGVLGVPDFETEIEEPIVADVTVDFDIGEIAGSFDKATGTLSLSGVAAGTLTAAGGTYEGEECKVLAEPSPLTLTTAGSSGGADNPRSGVPFVDGLAGAGAIAGEWEDMSATPVEPGNPDNVSFCNNVGNQIGGPGGIWLEQKGAVVPPPTPTTDGGGTSPPPPSPPVCVVPKLRGKTLARAKAALRAAHCTPGKVTKPKGLPVKKLVVRSSNPGAGATQANGKVHLRLGPKPRPQR